MSEGTPITDGNALSSCGCAPWPEYMDAAVGRRIERQLNALSDAVLKLPDVVLDDLGNPSDCIPTTRLIQLIGDARKLATSSEAEDDR